jgi:uncharacterized protein (DUF58 family)
MDDSGEIHYHLPRRAGGLRAGTHRATAAGAAMEFLAHRSLFDHPDPRRLDLRASLADLRGDWLVRVNRHRAAVTLLVLVDVSASMRFGEPAKLDLAADFVESLGRSAFRIGDAVGMLAFDAASRDDLQVAPRHGRGVGAAMAALLRTCASGPGGIGGLREVAMQVGPRPALVFLVSDFLWPLAGLGDIVDLLAPAHVVPLVVVDAAEDEAPARDGLALLCDAESSRLRTLWVRPALRARWRDATLARRSQLDAIFADRGLRPFTLRGAFDAQALSSHLLEDVA